MAAFRHLWLIPALVLLLHPLDVSAQGRGNKAKGGRGGGPAFCRSGAGHPVFGREWCRERGWDATYGGYGTNRAIPRNVYRDGFRAGYEAGFADGDRYGNGQRTSNFPWPF
jgi:hypothetical protein